jgi:hypothetical protein
MAMRPLKTGAFDDTVPMFIRRMPPAVKDQFKAWCAKRHVTMTDMIIVMMRMVVEATNDGRKSIAVEDITRSAKLLKGTLLS